MVAIEDMEIPSCCGECPLVEEQKDMYGLSFFYCNKTERMVDEKDVDTNCPLVEIGTCKDCSHRDPEDKMCDCGHSIVWQTSRPDNWYCADFEKRGAENG